MKILFLSDFLEELGEEKTKEFLSHFFVSRDKDVENFIRNLAIPYEKSGNARTFFFRQMKVTL